MSKIETNTIDTISGTTNLTIGSSNTSTITMPNGKLTGHMYPAFEARLSSSLGIDHNTFTKVPCGDEIFDTDSAYDNSTNYRFTPQVAGKYYCYFGLRGFAGGSDGDAVRFLIIAPYKNGSSVREYNSDDTDANELRTPAFFASAVIELNGSSDYLEFFGKVYAENLLNPGVSFQPNATYFGAYRIGA